ncbi:MAG: DUF1700 domain-containing protein [Anaerolineaceae bacterium]|nr:MAG: DUF1700 domain-containing protein [Anaerolineaceae bacterium]
MSRFDFMRKLEDLLSDTPIEERNEALKYYNDYFDDAGVDNEDNIISELGSPERIAGIIKADLQAEGSGSQDRGFFTEKGYEDTVYEEKKFEVIKPSEGKQDESSSGQNGSDTSQNSYYSNNTADTGNSGAGHRTNNNNNNNIALIILICIFAIPIGIPILISALAIIFSFVVTVFALLFGFGIAGIVMVPIGIAMIFIGLVKLGVPLLGLSLCGGGLVLLGLGILFAMLSFWLGKTLLPAIIRGIVYIFRLPFQNRSVRV